jgi:hypothetical protein
MAILILLPAFQAFYFLKWAAFFGFILNVALINKPKYQTKLRLGYTVLMVMYNFYLGYSFYSQKPASLLVIYVIGGLVCIWLYYIFIKAVTFFLVGRS